jgi:hypothetical protein
VTDYYNSENRSFQSDGNLTRSFGVMDARLLVIIYATAYEKYNRYNRTPARFSGIPYYTPGKTR